MPSLAETAAATAGEGPTARRGSRSGAIALAVAAIAGFLVVPRAWLPAAGREPTALVLPGVVEVQEVRLGSKVGGRVREVHILEGDRVEPGRRW